MPDITMCSNHSCPSSNICYRFKAQPSKYQSYSEFKPEPDTEQCHDFWPIERDKDVKNKSAKSAGK